jgi:membrane-associated phospholipid phosphatase
MKSMPWLATLWCCCLMLAPSAVAQTQSGQSLGRQLVSDFKFSANNGEADVEDIITSPLHLPDLWAPDGLLSKPAFYYTLLGAGALFGGAYAADQTVRARLRDMPHGTAYALENASWAAAGVGTVGLYCYGLGTDDADARYGAITSVEGAGLAEAITLVVKSGFGRLRPYQDHHSHTQFFDGGDSFDSSHAAPVFALAAGFSEYFNNSLYAAIPAYAAASAMGIARMGLDEHWLSDIAGAAIVGVGSTELLLYLHRQHAENPSRFRIFPIAPIQSPHNTGIGISFNF